MKEIKKFLRIYIPFAKSNIQTLASYPMNFVIFSIGQVTRAFVFYYLWLAVFKNSSHSNLNGFTSADMIIYVFMSVITSALVSSNDTDTIIGQEVKDGSITANLIRPISYHMRLLFNALGGSIYQLIFACLPLWTILVLLRFFTLHESPPSISTIILYLISTILAFGITFLFDFCFGLLSFFVTNLWGISHLKFAILRFFSGAIIPLAFFPIWLQKILNFFPFSSMQYTPIMIYLNKTSNFSVINSLAIQLFWLILLSALSAALWNKATKYLTILGG